MNKPIPEFNEADIGEQLDFEGKVVEIIVKGKGKTIQLSMDDLLEVNNEMR